MFVIFDQGVYLKLSRTELVMLFMPQWVKELDIAHIVCNSNTLIVYGKPYNGPPRDHQPSTRPIPPSHCSPLRSRTSMCEIHKSLTPSGPPWPPWMSGHNDHETAQWLQLQPSCGSPPVHDGGPSHRSVGYRQDFGALNTLRPRQSGHHFAYIPHVFSYLTKHHSWKYMCKKHGYHNIVYPHTSQSNRSDF